MIIFFFCIQADLDDEEAETKMERPGHVFYCNTWEALVFYVVGGCFEADSDEELEDQWRKASIDHNISNNNKEHERLRPEQHPGFTKHGCLAQNSKGKGVGPNVSPCFGDFDMAQFGLIPEPVCGYIRLTS